MKILVTGSSGFLGRHLCTALKQAGHDLTELTSKNFHLSDHGEVKFDQIYHLAAWTQAGDFCLHHPGEQWLINQKINTQVLEFWKESQPQAKLICMGTSCSYDPLLPLEEENYLKGDPIESLRTYAMTKRMLLYGLMAINQQFGLDYLYLIPSTLYGPHYHQDGRQLHFIFDLIRKILSGQREGDPVILWGDGTQKRELVHVQDFVSILIELAQTQKNSWINIGSGCEYSINEFAEKICFNVGYPFEKIQFDRSKYVGAKSKVLSIKKLQSLTAHYQTISLDQGLHDTIDWFAQL